MRKYYLPEVQIISVQNVEIFFKINKRILKLTVIFVVSSQFHPSLTLPLPRGGKGGVLNLMEEFLFEINSLSNYLLLLKNIFDRIDPVSNFKKYCY